MNHLLTLPISNSISFVQPTMQHSDKLFNLIDSDRKHLEKFLSFVKLTKTSTDTTNFLKSKITGEANGTDRLFLIYFEGKLVGTIDIHFIDEKNKLGEIGYWLHSDYINKGIISTAVNKICDIAFDDLKLNKLSLLADTKNIASNKVAQKCGFTLVGTLKEEQFTNDTFQDMNLYYLLKNDYLTK